MSSGQVHKETWLFSDANTPQKTIQLTFHLLTLNLRLNTIISESNKFKLNFFSVFIYVVTVLQPNKNWAAK
jgi:hypothetical protein